MRWIILILGLSLSGCYIQSQGRYYAEGPPPLQSTSIEQANAMVGVQQPSAYKVGFMEGCDSGRLSSGDKSFIFKKDTKRFDTDDVYKQGWNDGFNRCASGEGAPARTSYYQSNYRYDYYYPTTTYAGFYYPSYYYSPGFSIFGGYYGSHRHRQHIHRNNYYYTPWRGGHIHRGHKHRGYRGRSYIARSWGGKHRHKSRRQNGWLRKSGGGGHSHKGWSGKSRGGGKGGGKSWSGKSRGGGGKSGGRNGWLR